MAEAFEARNITRHSRAGGNLGWIPACAGITALWLFSFSAMAQTQAVPALTEPQKFLVQCNPQNKPELQKVCGCLLESIEMTLTVKEFNSLEAREKAGQLTAEELDQKARLVGNNKLIIKACMQR